MFKISIQLLLRIFYDKNINISLQKKEYKSPFMECWVIREIGNGEENLVYYNFTDSEILCDEKGNFIASEEWAEMLLEYKEILTSGGVRV